MKKLFLGLAVAILFGGCASSLKYIAADEVVELDVELAGVGWNGVKVPQSGIAKVFGGQGMSPELMVKNIPAEANAIVVEYNDLDYPPMKEDGGHGAYFVWTHGEQSVLIQSVAEQIYELPEGVFIEHRHMAHHEQVRGGVYLAPGSGGKNHRYEVVVKAVHKPASKKEKAVLLGIKRFLIGRY
ncbi:hypothetical protein KAR48_02965 [bacterium]|nr:hypothetical protein [bacterium]